MINKFVSIQLFWCITKKTMLSYEIKIDFCLFVLERIYIYVYFDFKNMVIIKLFIFYETTEIKSIKQDEF